METIVSDSIVEIPVTFRMREEDHRRILETKQEIGLIANYMLEQYAKGGVMVKASHARYLENLAGRPVRTSETVVDIVESGTSRHSAAGYLSVQYNVDPAFAVPLEEIARQQSRTVEEIVQEAMTIVFTNGWLYAISCEGGSINLTKEMRQELEQAMGKKNITGQDLVDWATKQPAPPRISKLRQEVRARMGLQEIA